MGKIKFLLGIGVFVIATIIGHEILFEKKLGDVGVVGMMACIIGIVTYIDLKSHNFSRKDIIESAIYAFKRMFLMRFLVAGVP